MSLILEAIAWLSAPENWSGANGIPVRAAQHVALASLVLLISAAIALPLGVIIGHTGRGRGFVIAASGGLRAVPTLGLLTMLALMLGIGLEAPIIALVVLAVPSMLAGTYAGIEALDRATIDASRSIGFTERQIVWLELRLAAPLIIGGIRASALQIIATTTLAAYTADVGLGRFLFSGLKSRQYDEMLGGSLVVTALALAVDILLLVAQRASQRQADPTTRKASS